MGGSCWLSVEKLSHGSESQSDLRFQFSIFNFQFHAPSVSIAASVPAMAAKVVLTNTPLNERSVPESAHPAFKAN